MIAQRIQGFVLRTPGCTSVCAPLRYKLFSNGRPAICSRFEEVTGVTRVLTQFYCEAVLLKHLATTVNYLLTLWLLYVSLLLMQ